MTYLLIFSPSFYQNVPYQARKFDTYEQLEVAVADIKAEDAPDLSVKVFMLNSGMSEAALDAFTELALRFHDECYYHQIAFHWPGEKDVD